MNKLIQERGNKTSGENEFIKRSLEKTLHHNIIHHLLRMGSIWSRNFLYCTWQILIFFQK